MGWFGPRGNCGCCACTPIEYEPQDACECLDGDGNTVAMPMITVTVTDFGCSTCSQSDIIIELDCGEATNTVTTSCVTVRAVYSAGVDGSGDRLDGVINVQVESSNGVTTGGPGPPASGYTRHTFQWNQSDHPPKYENCDVSDPRASEVEESVFLCDWELTNDTVQCFNSVNSLINCSLRTTPWDCNIDNASATWV